MKDYKIGYLLNPLNKKIRKPVPRKKTCEVTVPARVNTFLCHHSYFVHPPRSQIYPVGSINFAVAKFAKAEVDLRDDNKITITAEKKYVAIIQHAVKIMQKTLNIDYGFDIKAKILHNVSHGGLGSSSAVMTAVAQGINMLMGGVLSVSDITRLISQNYGEESSKSGYISSSASIGGSTAIGLAGKSLIIMGGESEIWYGGSLPKEYCAVLLYPRKIKKISKTKDQALNKKEISLLKTVDRGWENIKESMLRDKIIPSLKRKDYSDLFRAINMYIIGAYGNIPEYFNFRWESSGVKFDLLIYNIFSKLFSSLQINENCFFVSSNGPLVVVITKYPRRVKKLLASLEKRFSIEDVDIL